MSPIRSWGTGGLEALGNIFIEVSFQKDTEQHGKAKKKVSDDRGTKGKTSIIIIGHCKV